jgi:hypothetical protein
VLVTLDKFNKVINTTSPEGSGTRGTVDWRQYAAHLNVTTDATKICVGVILTGSGAAWADDFVVNLRKKRTSFHAPSDRQ